MSKLILTVDDSASMRMFTDAPTAAEWLAGRIGMEPGVLLRAVAALPH